MTAANGPIRRTVTVANPPLGLHLRPANAIARLVRRSKCAVTVTCGDKVADGRSPTDLLMLFAPPGTELVLEIAGDGAAETVDAVVAILTAAGEPDEHRSSS
jgi:phosphotransferase system HPr (HPr) family protein